MHTRQCSDSSHLICQYCAIQSSIRMAETMKIAMGCRWKGCDTKTYFCIWYTSCVFCTFMNCHASVCETQRHGRVWQMESGLERHRINGAGHLSKSPHTNLLPLAAPGQIQTQIQIQIQINQVARLSKYPHTNTLLLLLLHKFCP